MNRGANFLAELQEQVIIGDGAYGTEFLAQGCALKGGFERLNIENPDLVLNLHRSYIQAGSRLIETNTFQANRINLARYNAGDRFEEILARGVQLAQKAAARSKEPVYIAASIGPIPPREGEPLTLDEQVQLFKEQALILIENGADVLLLETFTKTVELMNALKAVRNLAQIPVMGQMVFERGGVTSDGLNGRDVYELLIQNGAAIAGANCGDGVPALMSGLRRMPSSGKPLSAYMNAGYSEQAEGRQLFLASPAYLAERALELAAGGVRIIGGCCGTGPVTIAAIAEKIRQLKPAVKLTAEPAPKKRGPGSEPAAGYPAGNIMVPTGILVELDPPKNINLAKITAAAEQLKQSGVEYITVADNPLASPRVDVITVAGVLKHQTGINIIPHITGRDRNRIGLRSAVMAGLALGIYNFLCVTGDPVKMYHETNTTGVFDVNSIGLIRLMDEINRSENIFGQDQAARIAIGCALNPNVVNFDGQLNKLKRKIDAGAHFVLTQPVFDFKGAEKLYSSLARAAVKIPVFVGLFPLTSARNALYLHNEVPGIAIPEEIRQRLTQYESLNDQRQVAREYICNLAETLLAITKNFYLITPGNKPEFVVPVIQRILPELKPNAG